MLLLAGCGGGGGGGSISPPQNIAPVANAGSDATVDEGSAVTLNGSGTDSDGTVTAFAWSQTGGPAVTLNNADQAAATFTAPAVDLSTDLSFSLTVTDNDGAMSNPDTVVITVVDNQAAAVTISGKAEYEFVNRGNTSGNGLDYQDVVQRPIRGAPVEARRASDSALIASSVTDENGDYALSVPVSTNLFVRIRAELQRGGSPGWNVEVRDNTSNTGVALNTRPLYVLDGPASDSGTANSTRNLLAGTGWGGSAYTGVRAAAPFSILDVFYNAVQLVLTADPNAVFPPLDAFWSVNNCPVEGTFEDGGIVTSFYSDDLDSLFLLGCEDVDTEEFDAHVIAHEWGHYFEDSFSRADSVGGSWTGVQRLDPRLAFGEGFGMALSAMIEANPRYRDSFDTGQSSSFEIDVESNTPTAAPGWYSAGSLQSILYDLYDTANDAPDIVSLGFAPLYDVLVGEQRDTIAMTSIFSFAAALKAQNPGNATAIDSLLTAQMINGPGIDAFGSNESNDAGNADVLPVYTELVPDQPAERLCVTDVFDGGDDGNKLGISRFLRITIAAAGTYTISQITAGTPDVTGQSDPDFLLFDRGVVAAAGLGTEVDQEVASAVLSPGDYVLEISEFAYYDPQSANIGSDRVCYDVSVSTN